jgi:hypothetical protein
MSSGDPSARPSTQAKLEEAIQPVKLHIKAEHDDNSIKANLDIVWLFVNRAISQAGDSNQKRRLKSQSEFEAYVKSEGDVERELELIKLLRSMAKQEVPWRDLFDNGTLFSSL